MFCGNAASTFLAMPEKRWLWSVLEEKGVLKHCMRSWNSILELSLKMGPQINEIVQFRFVLKSGTYKSI